MPRDVSVRGFLGHALIGKSQFRIIRNELFLTGQDKAASALLFCVINGTAQQGFSVAAPNGTITRLPILTNHRKEATIIQYAV